MDAGPLSDREPLPPAEARELIRRIVAERGVALSDHVIEQMAERDLNAADLELTLRGGWVEPGEYENGTWRYRVCSNRMTFLVAFRSERELRVVTGFRW